MTVINTSNYKDYVSSKSSFGTLIHMLEHPDKDGNDTIDLRNLNSITQLYGGKGNDIIYGSSSSKMNFLYGDNGYSFGDSSSDYLKIAGNDSIYGGEKCEFIAAGGGNDYINSGKGLNVIVFVPGDGVNTIANGGGSDYLYFPKSKYSELTYERQNNNLIINYGSGSKAVITDYFVKTSSVKGIADMTFPTNDFMTVWSYICYSLRDEAYCMNLLQKYLNESKTLPDLLASQKTLKSTITSAYKYKGSIYNEIITASSGNDDIVANKGNDTIYGKAGNDTINGGDGNDNLIGEAGNDVIYGGNGKDTVNGGDGNDRLYGGTGNDLFYGGNGTDYLNGGDGNDTIYGGADNDILYGCSGNDILNGGDGNDVFYAGAGTDSIYGGAGSDRYIFNKNDGNDIIYSSAGSDTIKFTNIDAASKLPTALTFSTASKDGNNLKIAYTSTDSVTINNLPKTAVKTIQANDGTSMAFSTLLGKVKINVKGSGEVKGTGYNDKISGSANNDTLYGRAGHDEIYGFAGNDTLYGGAGNDTINGADGDDRLYGEAGNDVIYGGNGKDFVKGGAGNDTIYGGAGNDTLYGEAGYNYINAGDGADIIYSTGHDIIYGCGGNDKFIFNTNTNYGWLSDGNGKNTISIAYKHLSEIKLLMNVQKDGTLTNFTMKNAVSDLPDSLGCALIKRSNSWGWNYSYFRNGGNYYSKSVGELRLGNSATVNAIDKIQANDGYYISQSSIQRVTSEVASWLTSKGYNNVQQAIYSDTSNGNLNTLIAMFNNNVWTKGA